MMMIADLALYAMLAVLLGIAIAETARSSREGETGILVWCFVGALGMAQFQRPTALPIPILAVGTFRPMQLAWLRPS
jgi:hypothetical protein